MRRWFLAIAIGLFLCTTANAHRLNEYLQATTIELSKSKLVLHLSLNPGKDVSKLVVSSIDLNNNGIFSTSEQNAYIKKVASDLIVFIDGREFPSRILSYEYPQLNDINNGIGEIRINLGYELDTLATYHQLILRNNHLSAIAVNLVNCLMPKDTSIRVIRQSRSTDQALYQLDFAYLDKNVVIVKKNVTSGNQDIWATVQSYIIHGIRHIISGYDHLLFLAALVLGAIGLWDLIKIITVFTIAHSLTLTLAIYGLVHITGRIVEPVIAASIVFVAVQNIISENKSTGIYRLIVAFIFGLFHGLGFAGGLLEVMHHMPNYLIVCAIIGFSLGVEIGNQVVILPLFIFLTQMGRAMTKSGKVRKFKTIKNWASGMVAAAGVVYFIIDLVYV